jgi:hypothetical protein
MAIVWPGMVATVFTDDGGASMYAGWLNCVPSIMINFGQIVAGLSAVRVGKTKIQCITVLTIGGALLACKLIEQSCLCSRLTTVIAMAASNVNSKSMSIAVIAVGTWFIGWNESVCLANSGIELLDQREIGTALGAAGSIRSVISSVASAIYVSVLNSRLSETIPSVVPPAAIGAGLPASSVPAFLGGFTTGSFAGIPGINDQIIAAGKQAYKVANVEAYSTVFFTTLAFTGIAIILSFFSPNVDDKMTGQVAVTLHKGTDQTAAEAEKLGHDV